MKLYYKRLDLTKLEYDYLIKCIDFEKLEEIEKRIVKDNENFEIVKSFNIIEKLNNPKEIEYSTNKSIAAMKATEIRSKKVKYKMNIAIEILQTQKKEITHYAIAKISKVSFNTVKKHLSDEHIKSLNEIKSC
jgi:response regulator of citrate/malate metabolism